MAGQFWAILVQSRGNAKSWADGRFDAGFTILGRAGGASSLASGETLLATIGDLARYHHHRHHLL